MLGLVSPHRKLIIGSISTYHPRLEHVPTNRTSSTAIEWGKGHPAAMAGAMRNATLFNLRPLQPCCRGEKQSRSRVWTPGNHVASTGGVCNSPQCLFNTDGCWFAVRPCLTSLLLSISRLLFYSDLFSLLLHVLSVVSRLGHCFSDSPPFFAYLGLLQEACRSLIHPTAFPLSDRFSLGQRSSSRYIIPDHLRGDLDDRVNYYGRIDHASNMNHQQIRAIGRCSDE